MFFIVICIIFKWERNRTKFIIYIYIYYLVWINLNLNGKILKFSKNIFKNEKKRFGTYNSKLQSITHNLRFLCILLSYRRDTPHQFSTGDSKYRLNIMSFRKYLAYVKFISYEKKMHVLNDKKNKKKLGISNYCH